MKTTGKWLMMFVFLWVFAGFFSTQLKAEEAATQAVNLKPALAGEVVLIDVKAGSLTIKDSTTSQETVFTTDAKTTVSKANVAAKLEELKVGEKVKVEYTEEGGKKTAASVLI